MADQVEYLGPVENKSSGVEYLGPLDTAKGTDQIEYLGPLTKGKEFVSSFLSRAGNYLKNELGKGALETAIGLAEPLVTYPLGKIAGGVGAIRGAITGEEGLPQKYEEAAHELLDIQPTTEPAKNILGVVGKGMEIITYPAKKLGEAVEYGDIPQLNVAPGSKTAGWVTQTVGELLTFGSIGKGYSKVKDIIAKPVTDMVEVYKGPSAYPETKKIIGEYTGALQMIDQKLSVLGKDINKSIPKDRQEAITNYMQAGGDEIILKDRAERSTTKHKKGYEDGLTLTEEEKQSAVLFRKRMDEIYLEAHEAGIEMDYVQNYVRQEWEKPEEAGKKILAQFRSGMFRTKPNEAMSRVFQDYFEGEQAGFKPKDKSIGYQVVAAERSIKRAIEARKALKALMDNTESDGRPTVVVGGAGTYIKSGDIVGEEAYYVKPNVLGKNTENYKYIDHPAFRKWKWIDADTEGKPILLEGNMWIHPDAYGKVNALLGRSWFQDYTIPEKYPVVGGTKPFATALRAGAFVKGTILIGPFHQFHVAEHAVFHKVSPFRLPEIDFEARPLLKEGVDHGLMIYSHNALSEFGEGLASGGLFHRIPVAGNYLRKYQEWLFQDYIPKLKAAMFEHAVERAERYYAKELESGKFTRDQLLDNAAKQANAAFGEQNYKYIGRNPTLQDALRIVLLAPDFLEARLKFAGQAIKGYGKEQAMALIRGAVIMGTTSQAMNMLFSDDHKPHWNRPFSVIIGGREYTPRSVVGDMMHLVTDPRSFWYHRLNPLWGRPVAEIATGRDFYGRKVGIEEAAKDVLKSWIPIPGQGFIKDNMGNSFLDSTVNSLLQSIGVSNFMYRTDAEKAAQEIAGEKRFGTQTKEEKAKFSIINKYAKKLTLADTDVKKDQIYSEIALDRVGGKLNEKDVKKIEDLTTPQLERQFSGMKAREAFAVWKKTNENEKIRLIHTMNVKIDNLDEEDQVKYAKEIDMVVSDIAELINKRIPKSEPTQVQPNKTNQEPTGGTQ